MASILSSANRTPLLMLMQPYMLVATPWLEGLTFRSGSLNHDLGLSVVLTTYA